MRPRITLIDRLGLKPAARVGAPFSSVLRRAVAWGLLCGITIVGADRAAAAEKTVTLAPVARSNPAGPLLIGSYGRVTSTTFLR